MADIREMSDSELSREWRVAEDAKGDDRCPRDIRPMEAYQSEIAEEIERRAAIDETFGRQSRRAAFIFDDTSTVSLDDLRRQGVEVSEVGVGEKTLFIPQAKRPGGEG